MRHCTVTDCNNNSSVPNISFIKFPKCEQRTVWVELVGKGRGDSWTPKPGSVICSAHFLSHQIDGADRLQNGANPCSNTDRATIFAGKPRYMYRQSS
jgi:hypothetical protein